MAYYKSKLPVDKDTPPVHAGVVTSFDHAKGLGIIRELTSGTDYRFRTDDMLSFGIYVDNKVLFSISRNGTAYNVARIVNTSKTVSL
jgi:hypothetical protein